MISLATRTYSEIGARSLPEFGSCFGLSDRMIQELRMGEIPPSLAEHTTSVRAIVDAGQVPVDAELMGALPNLGAISII